MFSNLIKNLFIGEGEEPSQRQKEREEAKYCEEHKAELTVIVELSGEDPHQTKLTANGVAMPLATWGWHLERPEERVMRKFKLLCETMNSQGVITDGMVIPPHRIQRIRYIGPKITRKDATE